MRAFIQTNNLLEKDTFDPRDFDQAILARNFHSPYAQQWSLGIQRQVRGSNVVEARYVGTRGVGLFQTVNRNPFIENLANGFSVCIESDEDFNCIREVRFPAFRKFLPAGVSPNPGTGRLLPQFGRIFSRENTGLSTYHSLQTRYGGRLFDQLSMNASYTWSKALDNVSEIRTFQEIEIAQNPFDINDGEHSYSGFDRRHVFSLNGTWDLPFFKDQKGILGHLLGGWQMSGVYLAGSGLRFTPSQFALFPSYLVDSPVRPFYGNPNADPKSVGITDVDLGLIFFGSLIEESPTGYYSLNEFNQTGELVPVAPDDVRFIYNGPEAARRFGTPYGDVQRNILRGPRINVVNAGFFKNTRIREGVSVQFRVEVFNLFNHPNPAYGFIFSSRGSIDGRGIPDRFIEEAGISGTPYFGFNDRGEMEYGRRVIQFGLKLIF